MSTKKKKSRRRAQAPAPKTSQVRRTALQFAEDYGDVALALEIMRNAKLSKPQPRYRSGRLTYRSLRRFTRSAVHGLTVHS
jgi:hypothetical protein